MRFFTLQPRGSLPCGRLLASGTTLAGTATAGSMSWRRENSCTMSRSSLASISSEGSTLYSPSTSKTVTGTLRSRESWKAWDCARQDRMTSERLRLQAGKFPLDGFSRGCGRGRSPRWRGQAAAAWLPTPCGLNVEDPALSLERHHMRAGLVRLHDSSPNDMTAASPRPHCRVCPSVIPGIQIRGVQWARVRH